MSRFVILYQGLTDPSAQEESSLVSALKKSKIVDRMPGTILVEGPEAEIASVICGRRNWTFTRERSVGIKPPHRNIKQAA
jgi:hypothetical protein